MSVYDIRGNLMADIGGTYISIASIKSAHPTYNDDALIDEAIAQAQVAGKTAKILWDGTDIYFAGNIAHECKGFGGIDFNGSKIYMPNYDGGIILSVVPDESDDIEVDAEDINETLTTDARLFGKVFRVNSVVSGNSDMCLGSRINVSSSSAVLYSAPTIAATPDGYYETGNLHLVPETGTVICYNVHDYPAVTFEVCNGTIISNSGSNMSEFVVCERSNVHVHNFVLSGSSAITTYHNGIFRFNGCCDVEVDHIWGLNPVVESLTSGYAIMLSGVSFAHIHDISVGDSTRWGSIGCHFLTHSVFERCKLNRWDCHFAQYGYNVIRDCNLGRLCYGGAGSGTILIENCVFIGNSSNNAWFIKSREDCVGVSEGNIIAKNCVFRFSATTPSNTVLWEEFINGTQPSNSKLTAPENGRRIIDNCQIPNNIKNVYKIGANNLEEKAFFANVLYAVKNTDIICSDTIVASKSGDLDTDLSFDGCKVNQCYITKAIYNALIKINACNFGANSIHVQKNTSVIHIANSEMDSINADSASSKLTVTGSKFYGTQSLTRFTAYALSGNIASSMASVNAHS